MYTMSIMDKINSYSSLGNLFNWNLWFTSSNSKVADYAQTVGNSPGNPLGNKAVVVYGKIGPDDEKITFKDNETGEVSAVYDLVNSPPEYYFTDMVFIQQKYEEALVDLYFYRAEASGSSRNPENRAIMDEAIAGTYWVAQQNGVTYTEEQIQEKFLEQLDEQLVPLEEGFNDRLDGSIPDIADYTTDFVNALRDYYLNPCLETFENTIQVAFAIEDKVDENWFSWERFFSGILSEISSGLSISFKNHGSDMEKELSSSMSPQVISPVEISQQESMLVFGVAPIRPG